MTRYQALRRVGCGPVTAGFIAFLNWVRDAPPGLIVFGTIEIEIKSTAPRGCKYAPGVTAEGDAPK